MSRPRNTQTLNFPELPKNQQKRPSKDFTDSLQKTHKNHPIFDIMAESWVSASLKAFDFCTYEAPIDIDDNPKAYLPAPGRCAWTMDTALTARPDADLTPLRRSALEPHYDQSVSPRLAAMTQAMNPSALLRTITVLVEREGMHLTSSYQRFKSALEGYDYGAPDFPLSMGSLLEFKRRPGRESLPVQYALRKDAESAGVTKDPAPEEDALFLWLEEDVEEASPAPKPNPLSIPELMLKFPPYQIDLGPQMLKEFSKAQDLLRTFALAKRPKTDVTRQLIGEQGSMTHLLDRIIDRFLIGSWTWPSLQNPRATPYYQQKEDALFRCFVQVRMANRSKLTAEALIGLSLLTGVSPDVWVRYALIHAQRTGYHHIKENEVVNIIQWANDNNAQALAQELSRLLGKLMRTESPSADVATAFTQRNTFPLWGIIPKDEQELEDL